MENVTKQSTFANIYLSEWTKTKGKNSKEDKNKQ